MPSTTRRRLTEDLSMSMAANDSTFGRGRVLESEMSIAGLDCRCDSETYRSWLLKIIGTFERRRELGDMSIPPLD